MIGGIESKEEIFDMYNAQKYLETLIDLHKETDMDMSDYIYSACNLIHIWFGMATPEDVKYEEENNKFKNEDLTLSKILSDKHFVPCLGWVDK